MTGFEWWKVYSVGPSLHFFETIESGRATSRNLDHKLGLNRVRGEPGEKGRKSAAT